MSVTPAEKCRVTLGDCQVTVLNEGYTSKHFLRLVAETRSRQLKYNSLAVGNLSQLIRLYRNEWLTHLPQVYPYYAVKSNNDPAVIQVLARLGCGFDCASKNEIKQVTSVLQSSQVADRIIFAHPCKNPSDILFAAKCGVDLMVFDNERELYKMKEFHPTARTVIRIRLVKNTENKSEGTVEKFGADVNLAEHLLEVASQLGINVVGVSFHTFRQSPHVYQALICAAGKLFDVAEKYGFSFKLLDIGGGFFSGANAFVPFNEAASAVREALDKYFSHRPDVRVIAEPGRFFSTTVFSMAACVIGFSPYAGDKDESETYGYTLSDGIFGSLYNDFVRKYFELKPMPLSDEIQTPLYRTTLWGPTCAGYDCIVKNCLLPKMDVGDWVMFEEAGAYSMVLSTDFNGYPKAKRFYVVDEEHANELI